MNDTLPSLPPNLSPQQAELLIQLDSLAELGGKKLKLRNFHVAIRDAVHWAPLWLAAGPAVAFTARLAGAQAPDWKTLVALTLAGPLNYFVVRVLWLYFHFQPERTVALALYDHHLTTQDRLVTADAFLASPDLNTAAQHSGFMRAAVNDAQPTVLRALAAPLPPLSVPDWQVRRASWWGVPAALALLFLGHFVLIPSDTGASTAGKTPPVLAATTPAPKPPEDPRVSARRSNRPPLSPIVAEPPGNEDKTQTQTRAMKRMARKEQATDGQPGSGGGSQASTSNSGAHSAGLASSQRSAPKEKKPEAKQTEDPEEKESPESKKKKPKPKKQDTSQLAVDANSGQGKSSSASGSLNPFEAPEEADKTGLGMLADAEDDGEDDEDEQEKSNPVNKPMGHTKQPAVDRNLSNQPPGDGPPQNGRGGPGDVKKTRGVPSMILGIPVPDRVPGTPSAGRSKVSQEYTRPKEESHPALEAQARDARVGTVGHIEQPDLVPWRRTLVENYFFSLRQRTDEATPAPASETPNR